MIRVALCRVPPAGKLCFVSCGSMLYISTNAPITLDIGKCESVFYSADEFSSKKDELSKQSKDSLVEHVVHIHKHFNVCNPMRQ